MNVKVNGLDRELPEGTSLAALLEELGLDRRYLVVEHNGDPLPRDRFEQLVLHDGDRLELVRPVAGG